MPVEPFTGDIFMVGFNFAPTGYLLCNGQTLQTSQYEGLFNVIGTTYGGDGVQTFALPDLRGRIPVHQGQAWTLGQTLGVESVNLSANHLPAHNHTLQASGSPGASVNPWGNVLAAPRRKLYDAAAAPTPMSSASMGPSGGSLPHTNIQPYLCVNFIICVDGIFPVPG